MRLTTGTGVTMIAVGAVLAFAVDPPRWIVQYVDVIDLGLILVWVGILVMAIHVYLYAPRRPKAPRRDRRPDAQREHTDRYAPGQFAAPRHQQYEPAAPQPAYGQQQGSGYPPTPSPTGGYEETAVYPPAPDRVAPPTPPAPGAAPSQPAPTDPSGGDQATQYFRRRR